MKKDVSSHFCRAVVVTCMDFRFQRFIHKWTDKTFKNDKFDKVAVAGSTKDLGFVLGQIDISVRLHHTKEAYLIHHEDCGAYGAEGTWERHVKDLEKAEKAVNKRFPELKVFLLYQKLDGEIVRVR